MLKKRLISGIVAAALALTAAPIPAFAQNEETSSGITVTADGDSRYAFQDPAVLGSEDSTRYDGRIWTDKTVSTEDYVIYGPAAGNVGLTIKIDDDAEFLVSYSAFATSTSIISQESVPVDLVLVLDMSPQINSAQGKTKAMLDAVSDAIRQIMEINPKNRVGVIAYSSQAEALLPLDQYETVDFHFTDNGRNQWGQTEGGTVTCTYTNAGGNSNSRTFTIASNYKSGVDKYTQYGIYAGMQVLMEANPTTDSTVKRQPTMILLSEGEPKIASTKIVGPTKSTVPPGGDSHYNSDAVHDDGVEVHRNFNLPDSDGSDRTHNDSRHAQTFATLLTAAYWKAQVSQKYSSDTETREMQLYTIGVRMDSANSPGLAKIVLNPKENLEESASEFSDAFIGYITDYRGNKAVNIPDAGENGHTTAFVPDSALGLSIVDNLKYNDGFYEVTGSNDNLDWSTVLEEVIAHVTNTAPKVPTHVENTGDLDSDGYITYVDPIGEYMEVKAVKTLIFNHQVYHLENPRGETQADGSTVYTFSAGAQVPSPAGGMVSLEDIKISVAPDGDNAETLTVKIPASLIPLRTNTVTLDVDEKPVSNVTNNAYPLRLFYTVGLREGIVDRQTGKVVTEAVSDEYLAAHADEDTGRVSFYANRYSGMGADDTGASIIDTPAEDAETVGNARTTFIPAQNNPFYYVQEDTLLYTGGTSGIVGAGGELGTPAEEPFNKDTTYYFAVDFYEGSGAADDPVRKTTAVVSRPASSFMANDDGSDETKDVIANENGQLVIRAGRPRLGYLTDFIRYKENHDHYYDPDDEGGVDTNPGNRTGTASTFYYPTYAGNGEFEMYLGNNGRLTAGAPDPAVGTLSIGKFVVSKDEEKEEFTFNVQLMDGENNPLSGPFDYTGTAADPSEEAAEDGKLELIDGSGTITLRDGQGITIQGLPKDTRWTVTEEQGGSADYLVTAFPSSAGGAAAHGNTASGTIAHHGAEDVVTFVNYYEEAAGTLVVKKEVQGDAPDGAEYHFEATLTKPDGEERTESFLLAANGIKSFEGLPLGTTYTVTEVMESSGGEEEQPGEGEAPGQTGQENTESTESGEAEQPDPGDAAAPGDGGAGDPQLPDDEDGGQPGSGEPAGDETPEDADHVEDSGDSPPPDSAGEGEAAPPSEEDQQLPDGSTDEEPSPGDSETQPGSDDQASEEGRQADPAGEPLLMARTLSAVSSLPDTEDQAPAQGAAPGNGNTPEGGDIPGDGDPGDGSVPEDEQLPEDNDTNENGGTDSGGTLPTDGLIPANEPEPAEPAPEAPAFTPLVQTQRGTIAQEGELTLTFVNTYEGDNARPGTLTIEKIVDGENPDPDAEFVFHVEYPDNGGTQTKHIHLTAGDTSEPIAIPAGAYTVYEEKHDGYTPVVREMSGVMAGGAEVRLEFRNVPGSTAGEPAVYLPLPAVRKYVSGNNVPAQEFTFTLEGEKEGDEDAYVPMPAHGVDSVTAGRGESASFGYITYRPENAGTYIYTIKEDTPDGGDGGAGSWTYDDTVYTYTVKVEYEGGELKVTPSMQKGGADTAQGEFAFNNTYLDPSEVPEPEPEPEPPRPGNGDDDDRDDTTDHPAQKDPEADENPNTGGYLEDAVSNPNTGLPDQGFPAPSASPEPKADVEEAARESFGTMPAIWFAGALTAAAAAAGGAAWLRKRKEGGS